MVAIEKAGPRGLGERESIKRHGVRLRKEGELYVVPQLCTIASVAVIYILHVRIYRRSCLVVIMYTLGIHHRIWDWTGKAQGL